MHLLTCKRIFGYVPIMKDLQYTDRQNLYAISEPVTDKVC